LSGDRQIALEVSVLLSQVVVAADPSYELDLLTLRNVVGSSVQALIDSYGFVVGCGYDLEITAACTPDGEVTIFGVDISEITRRPTEITFPVMLTDIFPTTQGIYLRRALADLRQAIRSPGDTGFYCFRAIEALRHFWRAGDNEDPESEWRTMSAALRVDKTVTDWLKAWANPQRHGEFAEMSGDERTQAMLTAWEVVDRFCRLALSNDALDDIALFRRPGS
jgi:hypothetical protein